MTSLTGKSGEFANDLQCFWDVRGVSTLVITVFLLKKPTLTANADKKQTYPSCKLTKLIRLRSGKKTMTLLNTLRMSKEENILSNMNHSGLSNLQFWSKMETLLS